MATLEKIRSKSVLLFVIIILALLAFILGDFLTSGRTYFGSGTTVAKAGSAQVDYEEYRQELEKTQEQYQKQGQEVDGDELSQMVIKSLLYRNMLQKHYDKLGLTVTDGEITRAMTGVIPHPSAQQFIYQVSSMLQLPEANASAVIDAINNPSKYGLTPDQGEQFKQAWASIEDNIDEEILYHKYTKLLDGLFGANNLDARATYDDISNARLVAFAAKPLNTIPDDEVEVTEEEIKAQWEKQKARYAIEEETRDVDYIYVEIAPSDADRIAGQKAVEDALVELNTAEGLGTVAHDRRFNTRRVSLPLSAINDSKLTEKLKSDTIGHASLYDSSLDNYTLIKLMGKSTGVDSLNLSVMAFADVTMADSLMQALNSGAKMADLANGSDIRTNDSIWASLITPGQFTAPVLDMLKTAETGKYYFINDTTTAQSFPGIYRVNRRNPEVTVYDFAVLNYIVDPSAETIADLNDKLNSFLSANSSAADFSANALENGYPVLSTLVSASTPHIANIADSRSAVKWVMDAKKGKVSPIIRDSKQNYLLAIAVKDIYDGDYKPYTASDINSELKAMAINAKKANKLIEELKGKGTDVATYAAAMEVPVDTTTTTLTSPLLLNLGLNEGYLQGSIANAKVGALNGPLAGNNYVMVYQVIEDQPQNRPYDIPEFSARFKQAVGFQNIDATKIFNILKGKDKMTNNSLNFIQGLEE